MKDPNEVKAKFLELIRPFVREANCAEIDEQTHLIEDLKVNSARMVDIILEAEDAFGISIDDAASDRLHTVGDAINLILEKSSVATQSK